MNFSVKYYLFYYIDKGDEEPILYAYTDDHEIAKVFKKYRNMNRFICKVIKASKKEINQLAYDYKNLFLIKKEMKFMNKKSGNILKTDMIVTIEESIMINRKSSSLILSELPVCCWINPEIFNQKVFNALEILEYTSFYKEITEEITDIGVSVDELAVFINLYGQTLKGE